MKEIERFRRERYIKMLNMLPELIADKQAPSFYYYHEKRYIDWDKINLNHIQVQVPLRDEVTKQRLKMQTEKNQLVAMNILGNRKLLKVDDVGLHLQGLMARSEGNPIQFQPFSLQRAALYDKGCITCGKANIIVLYHKDRHICLDCRQKITTLNGDPVVFTESLSEVIFQDDDSSIVVLGISDSNKLGKQVYEVQPDQLEIFGYKCYVSFSASDDLIVLLHDSLNIHKGVDPNVKRQTQIYQWESLDTKKNFRIKQLEGIDIILRNKKAVKYATQTHFGTQKFTTEQTLQTEQTQRTLLSPNSQQPKSQQMTPSKRMMLRSSTSMTSIKKK